MRYSAQPAAAGSQAGWRVSCAARLIAFGRQAAQAAAGVWRAVRAAQVRAAGVDAAAAAGGTGSQAEGVRHRRARAVVACDPVRAAVAAARVRSRAHLQAGVDAAAAQAAQDERTAFGRISERAAAVVGRRRAAGELVRGSSVLNNAFGHFSDEVHAAGDARAAAVRAAQVATTSARAAARA
jgi:hypothetical protein